MAGLKYILPVVLLLSACGTGGADAGNNSAPLPPIEASECSPWIPADYANNSAPGRFVIPTTMQFFGPTSHEGALTQVFGEWAHPDPALSSTLKTLRGDIPHTELASAWLTVVWQPNVEASAARLVAYESGHRTPPPGVSLGVVCATARMEMDHSGTEVLRFPNATTIDVTDQIRGLLASGKKAILGYEIRGDGATPVTVWEVRLEMHFSI